MPLTRRTLLKTSLASLAMPMPTLAETRLSKGRLTTVSDGHLMLPKSFFVGGLPEAEVDAILSAHGVTGDTLEPPCNLALYQDDENKVLFDAGSGTEFQSSVGALVDSLDTAGIAPEDITHVVFTHGHPDHLWGLLDDFGDPLFTEAAYVMGQTEWDYWTNPATVDTIGEARQAFAVGAARRLEMIADNITLVKDGDTALPGITAQASFGHTSGHMAFRINDEALVVGDAIGNAHLSLAHPEWEFGSDQDAATAAKTRTGLVNDLAAENMLLVGFHLPNGGMGRIEKAENGFQFIESDA